MGLNRAFIYPLIFGTKGFGNWIALCFKNDVFINLLVFNIAKLIPLSSSGNTKEIVITLLNT